MNTLGPLKVPTSAFIFLTLVVLFLFLLLIALMVLNKVLCFANCRMPSLIYVSNIENLESDSESDDSDDDIYNNYSNIAKTAEADKIRFSMRSTKFRDSSHSSLSLIKETDPSGDGIQSSDKEIVSETKSDIIDDSTIDKSPHVTDNFLLTKYNKVAIVRVHLSLDKTGSKLKIQVLQVFDLKKSDSKSDRRKSLSVQTLSYQVHCTILPAKKYKFKTKSKQGIDPLFNESFTVPKVTPETVDTLSIRFRIYAGQGTSLIAVGQCTCDLSSIDLSVDTEYNLTMNKPKDDESLSMDRLSISQSDLASMVSSTVEGDENIPELMVGLSLNSNTGRLTVEIIRGIKLSREKNRDFYVKLSLFSSSGQELSYTKTSVRKNTTSPVFRESFMFQIALFQMKEVTLMISVFAKKSIHRKILIGWISLGYKSSGEEETSHWAEVEEGVKAEVIRSHKLHQNNNSKKFLQ